MLNISPGDEHTATICRSVLFLQIAYTVFDVTHKATDVYWSGFISRLNVCTLSDLMCIST